MAPQAAAPSTKRPLSPEDSIPTADEGACCPTYSPHLCTSVDSLPQDHSRLLRPSAPRSICPRMLTRRRVRSTSPTSVDPSPTRSSLSSCPRSVPLTRPLASGGTRSAGGSRPSSRTLSLLCVLSRLSSRSCVSANSPASLVVVHAVRRRVVFFVRLCRHPRPHDLPT